MSNVQTNDLKSTALPAFNLRRLHAVIKLREASVESIARDADVTARHVWFVLGQRRRPSAQLLSVIRATIGESGFAFATGQTDSLIDSPPTMPPGESEGLAMGGER